MRYVTPVLPRELALQHREVGAKRGLEATDEFDLLIEELCHAGRAAVRSEIELVLV